MTVGEGRHVLIVDDHEIFRCGLRALLSESHAGYRISDAACIEDAIASDLSPPDLVLLDIRLPGISGLDGIACLKSHWPSAVIVVLSSLGGSEAQSEALGRGAAAYISKGEASGRIIRRLESLLADPTTSTVAPPRHGQLTPRQHEVLLFLCQGLSNKLIARRLALSENTVRRHVQDILEHFQVDSRSEAVFAARRRGLVE